MTTYPEFETAEQARDEAMCRTRELEEYADKLARKAALAFTSISGSNPTSAMRLFSDTCAEASATTRKFPGFYAEFVARLDAYRQQDKD